MTMSQNNNINNNNNITHNMKSSPIVASLGKTKTK